MTGTLIRPSNAQNANKRQAKRLPTRGTIGTPDGPEGRPVLKFFRNRHDWALFTSIKPWFSSRNTTLGTHGSLWADICVPKSLRNRHYWALFTSNKQWFSCRNITLGTHGSLWADICVPKSSGAATIEPFYEHKTIVFLHEYYTWHTGLPMSRHLCAKTL